MLTSECPVPLKRVGVQDIFASIGPVQQLQDKYGLTYEGIASAVREMVSK